MAIFTRMLCGLVCLVALGVGPTATSAAVETAGTVAQSTRAPALPRTLSARVVLGTKYGTAVRVSYCFASLPEDPYRRPWQLRLTVDNLGDDLMAVTVSWPVPKRCGTVVHPVGGLQQPYVLRYSTQSRRGTRSSRRQIRLALLPALARRPALPKQFVARVVTGTKYGRAVRVSYCFRSLPKDRSRRPSVIWVTIEARLIDPSDEATLGPDAGGPIFVKSRCGTATFGVKGFAAPYRISFVVESKNQTRSKPGRIVTG